MSNRSTRIKRQVKAVYAEIRAARERKARIESAFFQKCLVCNSKQWCDKERTRKCRAEVRERIMGGEG